MGFVMKKGQWLTHENGEPYARALMDIPYHSHLQSSDFEMADGKRPEEHTAIPTDVIRVDPFGLIVNACIDGKWNDIRQEAVSPASNPTE